MGIIGKIRHKAAAFYRDRLVKAQYPMLTIISRKQQEKNGAIGLVYMLHHIIEKNPHGIPTNEDLKVSPTFLEGIILKYKKQGFDFISIDQLNKIIKSNKKPERPFIAFTIDDGYLDNYTQALPIFERQQVPFTIFVATDFIDRKAILWWDIVEDLVLRNDFIIFDGNRYQCRTFQEKWNVFKEVYKTQLHLPCFRFAMHEHVNGFLSKSFAAEIFVQMTFKEWRNQKANVIEKALKDKEKILANLNNVKNIRAIVER